MADDLPPPSVKADQHVLDTNVIRGVPATVLSDVKASGLSLLVSPITVWEALSHFEDGKTSFSQVKAWFRAMQHCEVLEHPHAEIREAIGVAEHILECSSNRVARARERSRMLEGTPLTWSCAFAWSGITLNGKEAARNSNMAPRSIDATAGSK